MSERNGYIPGVPCWVDTTQADPGVLLSFYSGLFGWEFEDMMPEVQEAKYFVGRLRGRDVAAVGSLPDGAPRTASWNTYIWVDSTDETVSKAVQAGGKVLREPMEVMGAGRMAVLSDPEGAVFCIWQAKGHMGAGVVNENGALNFNNLATRDIEGAKAFYGALFGWTTLSLPQGEMWALPGYGDHLEQSTPGLRQQMARMGAPEGFIDVVAAVDRIAKDDNQTPAQWRVVFAVDDAKEAAASSRALGAEVVRGPVDAPWTRVAVIRDPGGAVFTVSQFVFENKDLTGERPLG